MFHSPKIIAFVFDAFRIAARSAFRES